MKAHCITGFLFTFLLLTAFTMQGQTIEISATTVGQVNGVSVAVSGVYRDAAPGTSGKKRVVNLTIGGEEKVSPAYPGLKLDIKGENWMVQKVKKPCFGRGSVVLVKGE